MKTIKLLLLMSLIALFVGLPAISMADTYSLAFDWEEDSYALTRVDEGVDTFTSVSVSMKMFDIYSDNTPGAPGVYYYLAKVSIPPGQEVTGASVVPTWGQTEELRYHLMPNRAGTHSTAYDENPLTAIPEYQFETSEFHQNPALYEQSYPEQLVKSFRTEYSMTGLGVASVLFAVQKYNPKSKVLSFMDRAILTLDLIYVDVEMPDTVTALELHRDIEIVTKAVNVNPEDVQDNLRSMTIMDTPLPVFCRQIDPPVLTSVIDVPGAQKIGTAIYLPQFEDEAGRWVDWQWYHARAYEHVSTEWIDGNYTGNTIWEKIAKYLYDMDTTYYNFSEVQFFGLVPAPLTCMMDCVPGEIDREADANIVGYSYHYFAVARPPFFCNADGDEIACEPGDFTTNRIYYNIGVFGATNQDEMNGMVDRDIGFNDDLSGIYGITVVTADQSTDSLVDSLVINTLNIPSQCVQLFFEGRDDVRGGFIENPNQSVAPLINPFVDEKYYGAFFGAGLPDILLTMRPFYLGDAYSYFDPIQIGQWSNGSGVQLFANSFGAVEPGPWFWYSYQYSLAHEDHLNRGSIDIGYNRESNWRTSAYTFNQFFRFLTPGSLRDSPNIPFSLAFGATNYSLYHIPGFNPHAMTYYGSVNAVNAAHTRLTIAWGDTLLPPTQVSCPCINEFFYIQVFKHDPYMGPDAPLEGVTVVALKDGEFLGSWITNEQGIVSGYISAAFTGQFNWCVFMASDQPANELYWSTSVGKQAPNIEENSNFKGAGETVSENVPVSYFLGQNYPNPFNASTNIKFGLPEPSEVTVEVFNINGRKVVTLVNEYLSAGYHNVSWHADNVSSGAYFYRIRANDFISQKKLVLVK